ncbi:MAG: DNA-processing protein DprA [Planctomycetales bacterium]|nr:DNA-processing protein DprA [Planctomycetales bacterium]
MDAEARALLQLHLTDGIGPRLVQNLLRRFGTAQAATAADATDLRQVDGIGDELARAIVSDSDGAVVDAECERCGRAGVEIVAWSSAAYPVGLQDIPDPPPILYVKGRLIEADQLAVGIVGTRHASHYGLRQTERLSTSLSLAGLTIVSGLARGIDAAAHRAALAAGGRTLAVLAGGLSEIYPPQHQELAAQICQSGALISEVSLATKPRRGCFPRRNRLISGLSLGAVIMEASERSGAMITARMAMEQGREVFAVPGPIDSPNSRGCHRLLRDGAKLVECVDDVLEELGPLVMPTVTEQGETVRDGRELQLNSQEQTVLRAIADDSPSVNEIIQRSGLPVQRVLATLSVLETRHLVHRIGGDRVSRSWR